MKRYSKLFRPIYLVPNGGDRNFLLGAIQRRLSIGTEVP